MEQETLEGKPPDDLAAMEHRVRVRRLREYHHRERDILSIIPCAEHAGWPSAVGASALPALEVLLACPACEVHVRDVCLGCSALAGHDVTFPCRTIDLLDGLVPRDEAKQITRAHEGGDHSTCPPDCPARLAAMERARDNGMPD
jgi:hypothetical protein